MESHCFISEPRPGAAIGPRPDALMRFIKGVSTVFNDLLGTVGLEPLVTFTEAMPLRGPFATMGSIGMIFVITWPFLVYLIPGPEVLVGLMAALWELVQIIITALCLDEFGVQYRTEAYTEEARAKVLHHLMSQIRSRSERNSGKRHMLHILLGGQNPLGAHE